MAEFSVREVEGMRQIRIDMAEETVRARHGAMSTMQGKVVMTPRLPGPRDIFRSFFTSDARIRPYYSGTGSVLLQPTLGGYHLLDVTPGERWILEPGAYWASEGSVQLGMTREPAWSSFWAGDGFLSWKTTVSGVGKVAINAPGPVETIYVDDSDFRVQGRLVLGRTGGLKFSSRAPARWPRSLISGQRRLRAFHGTGRALVCWVPYWNERLYRTIAEQAAIGGGE
ncbi:hypothetical protein CG51_01545 [Haematobacter missouriensis]|uniref:AIM24 family protein n=1 Tax=Haematobacter missouriensis TaxID=366616 RepID=A0A212AHJ3_9RHOB|nr:AIM24 family protein [Haematobacter missouriensis]KFI32501.1 hypothetical protein CG51_01545 [Haematobacter missouriensis]OWJ76519.1 AIM24 family protein [Haematobacter missouriensis]OWJ80964.1 AIM24 family protein [Haematobacter missouriensis]